VSVGFDVVSLASAADREAELEELRAGLTGAPRELQPRWLYDERGSRLFDEITRLPEYYLTRAERSILRRDAAEIARLTGADTLVELGAGTADKTRLLLDALAPRRFVALELSESALARSSKALAREYPATEVVGVAGDFRRHLALLPSGGRRLLAFLGSTIGNLTPPLRARFLRDVADALAGGDAFLLGVDLVKEPARLLAAYQDAAGVTRAFELNVLRVLNRELGADFAPEAFEYAARWDPAAEWIEMSLRSLRDQTVRLPALGLELGFAAGEPMRTEVSAKFRITGIAAELRAAGLGVTRSWTDDAGDFALVLAERL